jgi:hypothetical protein
MEALHTDDIFNVLNSNRITQPYFRGVYASDQLPIYSPTASLYVCNTDPSDAPGTHWIVIFIDDEKRGEYFDSFGRHPSVKTFERFLNQNTISWKCNTAAVQHPLSDACGYHCIYFAVHRCIGYDMNAVMNMYSDDVWFNDDIVKTFVFDRLL